MKTVKLSELPDDMKLSLEYSHGAYTVAELKSKIIDFGEPHHLSTPWYTIKDAVWIPSASSMIETLIENAQNDMYEDWDEKANDCVDDGVVEAIQLMLEEMFAPAKDYWEYVDLVEIDILPKAIVSTE